MDICDEQAVQACIAENQIDVVVNCAAYTAVDKAEDNEELCRKLNQEAPGILARAAQAHGAAMIQVSTDYVFDGTAHIPYKEDCEPCPNSVYGFTKLGGEKEVMQNCEKAMVIRTAWLYSIYGNNFVKTMIRLGRERESLGVVLIRLVRRRMQMIWHKLSMPPLIRVLYRVFIISVMKAYVHGMILRWLYIALRISRHAR